MSVGQSDETCAQHAVSGRCSSRAAGAQISAIVAVPTVPAAPATSTRALVFGRKVGLRNLGDCKPALLQQPQQARLLQACMQPAGGGQPASGAGQALGAEAEPGVETRCLFHPHTHEVHSGSASAPLDLKARKTRVWGAASARSVAASAAYAAGSYTTSDATMASKVGSGGGGSGDVG